MAIERILLLMCQLPTKKSKLLNRRAFLFTNGQGKTNYTADSLFRLAYQLQTQNIKLNIIPIDFMITYNLSDNNIDTTE